MKRLLWLGVLLLLQAGSSLARAEDCLTSAQQLRAHVNSLLERMPSTLREDGGPGLVWMCGHTGGPYTSSALIGPGGGRAAHRVVYRAAVNGGAIYADPTGQAVFCDDGRAFYARRGTEGGWCH